MILIVVMMSICINNAKVIKMYYFIAYSFLIIIGFILYCIMLMFIGKQKCQTKDVQHLIKKLLVGGENEI